MRQLEEEAVDSIKESDPSSVEEINSALHSLPFEYPEYQLAIGDFVSNGSLGFGFETGEGFSELYWDNYRDYNRLVGEELRKDIDNIRGIYPLAGNDEFVSQGIGGNWIYAGLDPFKGESSNIASIKCRFPFEDDSQDQESAIPLQEGSRNVFYMKGGTTKDDLEDYLAEEAKRILESGGFLVVDSDEEFRGFDFKRKVEPTPEYIPIMGQKMPYVPTGGLFLYEKQ